MFNQKLRRKIKNEKIMRWQIDLPCYSFNIEYKLGKNNVTPDMLFRVVITIPTTNTLYKVHDPLRHPGVVRLSHFVKMKNQPYFLDAIK